MSSSKQDKTTKTTTTTSKINKYLSPATDTQQNKFDLIDASDHLESIGKLSEQSGNSNRELNNNSILAVEGSGLFSMLKMDLKRKSPNDSKHSTIAITDIDTNGDAKLYAPENLSKQVPEEPVLQTPSYSSIFAPSSYSKSSSPSQQQQQSPYKQTPLRVNQSNYRESENQAFPILNGRVPGRKLATSKCNDNKNNHENLEVEDDLEEEDIDEKMPFNTAKVRSSVRRISPGESQRCQSPNSKPSIFAFNHRCDLDHHQLNNNQENPHTKISIHENRLPTFSQCQAGYNQHNETFASRKVYLPEQPLCYRCDCSDCHKKLKSTSVMLDGGSNQSPESYTKKHSRTKTMHLILKSIILVLLTLLLLMLFIGIILASHFLPQMFDRVLNASRSFNVTIAG